MNNKELKIQELEYLDYDVSIFKSCQRRKRGQFKNNIWLNLFWKGHSQVVKAITYKALQFSITRIKHELPIFDK